MAFACLVRHAMIESIVNDTKCTLDVSKLSFSKSFRHFKCFLMDITRRNTENYEQLWNRLLSLIRKSLVNSKAGRSYSRDTKAIRQNARGTMKKKAGRPAKKKEVEIAEEDREQLLSCGQGEDVYYELLD